MNYKFSHIGIPTTEEKMYKSLLVLTLALMTVFISRPAIAENASSWTGINIDVKASHTVTTTQKVEEQSDGFYRLNVTLANEGPQPLTLEKITVRIPLGVKTSPDTEILFGGSDMWRYTVLRKPLSKQDKMSMSTFYGMIKLAQDDYLFAGALSWRIFLPKITYNKDAYEIWSNGENKQLLPGQKIDYEQIVLRRSKNWVTLLTQFGDAIAKENKVGKLKDVTFNGWATWDYYGRVFNTEDVNKNMDELNKLPVKSNMLQVDGGWWPERGDYSLVHEKLPGGLKAIGARIKAEGKIFGLHFDGFRGDAKSEICKIHPEYFLHDNDGKLIVTSKDTPDHKMDFTYFDYSHPGARAHIAECIRVMREDWGVTYFKIDFMCNGLAEFNASLSKPYKAYDPTITSVERFRLAMQMMRKAIGPDNYFLGCTAAFGPTIGFVDGMRTGLDIDPRYEAFGHRTLANSSNFYLKSVFNLDSDYIVARAAADEDAAVCPENNKSGGTVTDNEAKMWADFVTLFGNVRLNSDNLVTLRAARKAIVAEALKAPKMDETVPLDIWQHAKDKNDAVELIISRNESGIYLGIFNWGDSLKAYSLPAFGKSANDVQLKGRHSLILKYEGTDAFTVLCDKLKG